MVGFNTSHVVIQQEFGKYTGSVTGFNTSHVVIQLETDASICSPFCFNTSHVVIQLLQLILNKLTNLFQYISCCYSTSWLRDREAERKVSIHLMLLFNHSKINILKSYDTTKSFIFKLFFDFYQPFVTFNIAMTKSPSNPRYYWIYMIT